MARGEGRGEVGTCEPRIEVTGAGAGVADVNQVLKVLLKEH